jgi:hypothetical protein
LSKTSKAPRERKTFEAMPVADMGFIYNI